MPRFLPHHQTIQAFVMAILIPSIVAAFATVMYLKISSEGAASGFGSIFLVAFISVLAFGFAGCVVIGIPAHLALQSLGWTSQWTYLLAGFLSTGIFSVVLFFANNLHLDSFSEIIIPHLICGGPLAAWIFWRVARPDRSTALQQQP